MDLPLRRAGPACRDDGSSRPVRIGQPTRPTTPTRGCVVPVAIPHVFCGGPVAELHRAVGDPDLRQQAVSQHARKLKQAAGQTGIRYRVICIVRRVLGVVATARAGLGVAVTTLASSCV